MVDGPGFRFQCQTPFRSPPCRSRKSHPKMSAAQEPDKSPWARACWWRMVEGGLPPGLKAGIQTVVSPCEVN